MKKGVIASPLEFQYHMVGFTMDSALSQEMLRYYLLYWDEIVIPDNNLISMGVDHLSQLEQLDFVYRPLINHRGRFHDHGIADAILTSQFELASLYQKDPKIDWVIHQSNMERLAAPSKGVIEQNALKIRLTDLLPVPSEDVSYFDLVEFRHKRIDEFRHLHVLLDELYLQVLSSPDQSLSSKRAVSDLQSLINDLDKLTKERFGFINKISIEPSYSCKVKDLIQAPILVNALDAVQNLANHGTPSDMNTLTATAIGLSIGIVSNIELKLSPTKKPHDMTEKQRLSYLSEAAKEGLIGL